MAAWGIEAKLQLFVTFAIGKLDSAEAELTDEDEEDNYQELVVFTTVCARTPCAIVQPASLCFAPSPATLPVTMKEGRAWHGIDRDSRAT